MKRTDPFADLSDFMPRTSSLQAGGRQIDRLAEQMDFPSRQARHAASRRRYVTGRNQQINIKATPETIAKFYRLAGPRPLGEVLDRALDALEREGG